MKNPDYDPNWQDRFAAATTDEERTAAWYAKFKYTQDFRNELIYDIRFEAREYGLQFDLPVIDDDATIDEIWAALQPFWRRLRSAEREWQGVSPRLRRQLNYPE